MEPSWIETAVAVAIGIAALAAVVVVAANLLAPNGPAALPAGAAPLALQTQPPKVWPPAGLGCPGAQVLPIRVDHDGREMTFSTPSDGFTVSVVWPYGFSARLTDGRAELVTSDGTVFARDGDVISNLAGGAADNGDILVCISSASPPQVTRAS